MAFRAILSCFLLLQTACGINGNSEPPESPPKFPILGEAVEIPPLPDLDDDSVTKGRLLYVRHCASCHGIDLAGDPNWKVLNEDGTYLPPPHDSSGHTWHHSDQLLVEIILNGSDFFESQMEPFGGVLTEEEVQSILDFLKSAWGPSERATQWAATVRQAAQEDGE